MVVDCEKWLPYGTGNQSRSVAFYDEIANDNGGRLINANDMVHETVKINLVRRWFDNYYGESANN